MKKKYLLLFFLFCFTMQAQIIIPDVNFKARLLESNTTAGVAYGNGNTPIVVDTNGNGEIEVSEAALVQVLVINNASVSSLEGIQYFANLRNLQCNNNSLTSLNISSLPNVTYLDCSHNSLASLSLNQNSGYTGFKCSYNNLTSLNVNAMIHLVELDCSHNQLASLHAELIDNVLRKLDCSYNNLTTLQVPNFFPFVDMGDQQMELNCSHNQLSSITLLGAPEILSSLDLSFNNFTSLTFPQIEVNQGGNVNISNNPLTYLDLYNLVMTPYEFVDPGNLYINNTGLTELNVTATITPFNRKKLHINNNPNLVSVNFKNGYSDILWRYDFFLEEYVPYGLEITNNPQLALICTDGGEADYITGLVPGVAVTPYCTLTPGGNYNMISGNVNYNCPNGNPIHTNVKVMVNNANNASFIDLTDNSYTAYTATGNQSVSLQLEHPSYFTVTPASQTFNFIGYNNSQTADFCIANNGVHPDLQVSVLPMNDARPGFDAKYKIVYKNNGNQSQDGTVSITYDDAVLDFVSATPGVSTVAANSLSWNFVALRSFESREIELTLNLNSPTETPPLNINDILNYAVNINSVQTDDTPSDNTVNYNQTVVGSFDPNDKIVVEGTQLSIDKLDKYLHYIIRFQNTGNATAENVVVKDILDNNLDWTTLQLVSGSHQYRSTLTSGDTFEVFFENINLPSAILDEAGSHGYISFKIKPKSTLAIDDVISNTANIYFDFNFPIVTNTVNTTINTLSAPGFTKELFRLYPNPTASLLNIAASDNTILKKITIVNTLGQTVIRSKDKAIDVSPLTPGTYFVTVETDNGKATQKMIKL